MRFFVVLFALIAAACAAPQFGFGGSAANAAAGSQSFGGGFGPYGGGFGGSASHAAAQSQSFNAGGLGGGFSGSAANAAASSQTFNQGGGYYPGGHHFG